MISATCRRLVSRWRKESRTRNRMRLHGTWKIINSLLRMINGNKRYRHILPVLHLLMRCLDDCSIHLTGVDIKRTRSLYFLGIMAGIWEKKNIGENLHYGK